MKEYKNIIVNDISAKIGGALTILNEFISEIIKNESAKKYNWIIFVGTNRFDKYKKERKINIINVGKMNWLKRIWWEKKGIWKYLEKRKIKPDIAISLMNVGFGKIKIPNIIYIHQSIPFSDFDDYKWFELRYRLKKIFLFYEIKNTISNDSNIIVQTNWMKNAINEKLSIKRNKIFVVPPTTNLFEKKMPVKSQSNFSYNLFYPSIPGGSYKNHELLIKTIYEIKKENKKLGEKVQLIFTCKSEDRKLTKYYYKLAKKLGVSENIKWVGYLRKKEMIKYYIECDALVFPSKLETFGLPLIEAAFLGRPIFVLDKPYAHDVLDEYKGSIFLVNDPIIWAERISSFYKNNPIVFGSLENHSNNEWNNFFELIEKIICKKSNIYDTLGYFRH